jgi:hypothetical protein
MEKARAIFLKNGKKPNLHKAPGKKTFFPILRMSCNLVHILIMSFLTNPENLVKKSRAVSILRLPLNES